METVLEMPAPPEEAQNEEEKPPHLDTPRYVHHFDTWSLVRDLEGGGLSQDQSVTIRKAVRGILGDNMELARRALVTKSNVENVRMPPCRLCYCLLQPLPLAQSRCSMLTCPSLPL